MTYLAFSGDNEIRDLRNIIYLLEGLRRKLFSFWKV